MIFALESLANVKEDIKPLIKKHWELVALNQGVIKLNPDWENMLKWINQDYLEYSQQEK